MTNEQIKTWAKEKVKGKRWGLLGAIIVAGILTNLSFSTGSSDDGTRTTITLGWIFFFVEVGLNYYMIKFITDQSYEFNDIFHFKDDFGKDLVVGIVRDIFIFLWTLLFIIPGIIKAFAYSLVPMLMTDDKYKNLKVTEVLKKSEEMMNGHKMDYFRLQVSFIGWHILAIFTLGILELWIVPYQKAATTKFLYNIKNEFEGNGPQTSNPSQENTQTPNPSQENTQTASSKFCPNCGTEITSDTAFCPSCGTKVE